MKLNKADGGRKREVADVKNNMSCFDLKCDITMGSWKGNCGWGSQGHVKDGGALTDLS